jgi:1-acyl-sn-glycerol-3-phosphate acyltransferase
MTREATGRRLAKLVLGAYMRGWHALRIEGATLLPARGPALVLTNHASVLDIPALMALDPYPDTVFVVKASVVAVAPLSPLLNAWGAIAVDRDGRDVAGVRAIFAALRAGRVVALAPEGRRSPTGRLGAVNHVLARVAVRSGVPLVPVGIQGSFQALPRGSRRPRRRPILVRVGPSFTLARDTPDAAAACAIQCAIARLLPIDQQPDTTSLPEVERPALPRDRQADGAPSGGAHDDEPQEQASKRRRHAEAGRQPTSSSAAGAEVDHGDHLQDRLSEYEQRARRPITRRPIDRPTEQEVRLDCQHG